MINNKGQALVEYVLILPVFLFLLFAIYDFGMIFNAKNTLENDSIDVIDLYKNGKTIEEIKPLYNGINIEVMDEDGYKKIILNDKIKLITPGLNKIFGNPYSIDVVRYIANENEQ